MLRDMAVNIQDLILQIEQCETLEKHYAARAKDLRAQLHSISLAQPDGWDRKLRREKRTKSSIRWVEWLQSNGPTTRKAIADAVGLLTGPTPPYVDSLGKPMPEIPDDFYPADMMLRISVENEFGKGRPSDVYFLWSQRYTVFPTLRLNEDCKAIETLSEVATIEVDDLIDMEPESIVDDDPEPVVETSSGPTRYGSIQEWADGMHDSHFIYGRYGHKFTKEEMQELRDTCPEGVDANVAINLVAQGRMDQLLELLESQKAEPLLGVVSPIDLADLPPAPASAAQRQMIEDAQYE